MKIFYLMKRDIDDKKTGASAQKDREKSGITQAQLASVLGVLPAYLSGLECGKRGWSEKWAGKYAKALKSLTKA